MLQRLGESAVRERMRAEIAAHGLNNFGRIPSWDAVRIAISPHQPEFAGRTIGDIARARAVDPLDAVCDYLIADRGHTRIVVESMSEEDVQEIVRAKDVLVGSDGTVARALRHDRSGQAAPALLRHLSARARALRPGPGAAVAAAGRLQDDGRLGRGAGPRGPRAAARGLPRRRHRLRSGRRSPIALPTRIRTSTPPESAPSSSTALVVIDAGEHTGALPGQVLRRGRDLVPAGAK